jgi:hypothetical protein
MGLWLWHWITVLTTAVWYQKAGFLILIYQKSSNRSCPKKSVRALNSHIRSWRPNFDRFWNFSPQKQSVPSYIIKFVPGANSYLDFQMLQQFWDIFTSEASWPQKTTKRARQALLLRKKPLHSPALLSFIQPRTDEVGQRWCVRTNLARNGALIAIRQ